MLEFKYIKDGEISKKELERLPIMVCKAYYEGS